jgi:uncharacterized protein (DUF2147 family)
MKTTSAVLAISVALAAAITPASADETAAIGKWLSDDGKLTVAISKCETRLCGYIAGMSKPLDKRGKPKVDDKNPNPALRSRPLIGTPVFTDMKPDGAGKWVGRIYYAKDGRTYRASAKLKGDTFIVTACWTVLCKKFGFKRLP